MLGILERPTIEPTSIPKEPAALTTCSHIIFPFSVFNSHSPLKTLLISTEMPVDAISLRLDVVLARKMGYDFSHTNLRTGGDIDEEKYKEFLETIKGKNLLVCDHIEGESSISLEGIATLIRKYNPELVVLDGIYLVSTRTANKKQMWEQSHALFYGIKNLSLSFGGRTSPETRLPVFNLNRLI